MNLDMFRRMCAKPLVRAPQDHERLSITSAIVHIPTPRLAEIVDSEVRASLDAVIAAGGGILMIGLAQAELEISNGRFTAIVDVRLTTRERLMLCIKGAIDEQGRVEPDMASIAA